MSGAHLKLTPARSLFQSTFARLNAAVALSETKGEADAPWRRLVSHAPFHQGNCGEVRLFTGPDVFKIVTCSITAPAIGLDSHMLFALTPSDSAIPHFTVDCVQSGQQLAFHLDLLPRLDLATHLAYMDWAYNGLTETFMAAATLDGLSPAQISPRQRAVMSPWMVVNRATPDAFTSIEPLVHAYLDHWLSLVASGVPSSILSGTTSFELVARDRAAKALIFDPNIDKVWNQIRGLIGTDSVEAIRQELLRSSV